METRANYAIVGLFTLMVLAAAFGFVYWMTNYGDAGDMAPLNIRIPGSANGLSVGSPVRFNGISVGSVRGLTIDPDDASFVIARTDVRADAPITANTEAVLEIQGLTGSAYVELSAGQFRGEDILQEALETGIPGTLTADPSSVTNLLSTADQILTRANDVVAEIEGFVVDARGPLTNTLRNTETFSQALTDNADGIDRFLESVGALSETFSGLSGRLDTTMAAAENLMTSVDPAKIDSILSNVEQVSADLSEASGAASEIVTSFTTTADRLQGYTDTIGSSLERVDAIVGSVESVVSEVDAGQVGELIDNVTAASAEARTAIASTSAVVERFANRGEDVDAIISDVTATADRLNAVSARVDSVVGRIDTAIGESDVSDLLAEVDRAVRSFAEVAAAIDAASVNSAVANITAASESARQAAADTQSFTAQLTGRDEEIDRFMEDVTQTANRLNAISARVDGVVAKVDTALGEGDVENILADVQTAVRSLSQVAQSIDPERIDAALTDIAAASSSARQAANDTQSFTAQFAGRDEQIEAFIGDVSQMADRLNAASVRVDGVLAKVDEFLGDGDASALLVEAEEALNAVQAVAESINARVGPIAGNLERFSNSGLRDVEALITETRRSINRIERSISTIERNPQRLLFGGEEVKQFDGRVRR